ncbi:hemolysin family protein [Fulvimarina sp. 2208YS6-2-32]|uniref:Hemolysin family protein n=1 Tax=Fulvimarina uroteuthidis TaxID=3098149 RepID=A0ABU5I094_9HYPH|nr:hemolysin family protein [Fulvimarina sp. 2208YS6-2-32]MDY8108188.1 hemolysin family protein [Fulvimarina sp. 2208YS6-2-32]
MLIFNALIVFGLILLNGFFAMSELAVVSSKRSRLEQRAKKRKSGANAALKLAENPTTFLSTVQIGITLVGIFAGAYGGSVFAEPLAEILRQVPILRAIAYDLAFVLVVVVITYLSLIFGELAPKRMALARPEAVASFVAPFMRMMSKIGKPVVWLLEFSTRVVTAPFVNDDDREDEVTEEDVRSMIKEGTQLGVFKEKEREMLEGVIRIADRNVRSIMIPRREVDWLSIHDTEDETFEEILRAGHSRFPVLDNDEDTIVGIVQTKDLFALQRREGGFDLAVAMRKPLYVNEAMPILKLLEAFRDANLHIAVVLNEYGSFEGIATPQDILTAIAGSLPEGPEDAVSAFMRQDGSWLVDGAMPVHSFAAKAKTIEFPEDRDYETVAGFALEQIGHIPGVGEIFEWEGYTVEIVDLDGHRIDKLLFTQKPVEEDGEDSGED